MKRILIALLVLISQLAFIQTSHCDQRYGWLQYGADEAHTSIAHDDWDFKVYDKPAWTLKMRVPAGFSRNPVIDKGLCVIGDADKIYCLDVISGKTIWTQDVFDSVNSSCAIVGDIVIVCLNTRILALNLANGEIKWYINSAGSHLSSPTVYTDDKGNSSMYVTSSDKSGSAMKFNLSTGRMAWKHETEYACPSSMGLNVAEGLVGCGAHYKIEALSDSYGGSDFSYEISTQTFGATAAIDRYCIFTMSSGEVILLPKPYGSEDSVIYNAPGFTFWPPSRYKDTLILGCGDGILTRFDLSGKILWQKTMNGPVTDACTIMGDYVLVPVGSDKGTKQGSVNILNCEDGLEVKKIAIPADNVFQPVVAWDRMFVEYGPNEMYSSRVLACFGKQPRSTDEEPKLSVNPTKFTVEIPWRGETVRQVNFINEGKVPINMRFVGDAFISSSIETMSLNPGEKDTLRINIRAGIVKPGKYTGQIGIVIDDPDYGERIIATVVVSITVTEKITEPPFDVPPNSPRNVVARWVFDHVEVNWEPPQGGAYVTGYNLFKTWDDQEFSKTPMNSIKITGTSFSDIDVTPGHIYLYRVVAVGNKGLVSDPSSVVKVEIPIKLSAVKNLKAEVRNGQVLLSWESDQQVTFKVERNGDEIGKTKEQSFTDTNPPKERLIYKIFPSKDDNIGPEAFVVIDLTPIIEPQPPPPEPPSPPPDPPPVVKTTVLFTIGKDTAKVNGIEKPCQGIPYVNTGRTMVPFRFLGESISAKVSYTTDPLSGRVLTVQYLFNDKLIELMIGNKIAIVSGKAIELDVAPEIKSGRTFVPLRFVTEALGCDVLWDAAAKSVMITYPK